MLAWLGCRRGDGQQSGRALADACASLGHLKEEVERWVGGRDLPSRMADQINLWKTPALRGRIRRAIDVIRDRVALARDRMLPRRFIVDRHCKLNYTDHSVPTIDTSVNKDEASRLVIFDDHTPPGRFLEIGC